MDKSNLIGLGIMAAASIALIAAADPLYDAIKAKRIEDAAGGVETLTGVGEAEGFGGVVGAEVVIAGDKIVGLTLTGDKETPEIGGAAISTLQSSILEAGALDGVDGVSGATVTSAAVKEAVAKAIDTAKGITSEVTSETR